jgi:hypothetical protein
VVKSVDFPTESQLAKAGIGLRLSSMQNGAQNNRDLSGRLLGFVRVVVGGQAFDLAVQSMSFESDGKGVAGGFFSNDGQLGILVDEAASPSEAKAQIEQATAEAVRHLSRRLLN